MIVKFHARGSGVGSGPIGYLLGRDRQREGATLDRGDPDAIIAMIDASPYAKKYTSGVLSFSEADLDRESKDKIMSDFEKMLLPGLDADQYACLWVEHRDKDRLELNFVIPNIELHSGKRLQPWFHKRDLSRVNCWKNITNYTHQLTDPDNPLNHRTLVTPRNLPAAKKDVAEAITSSLMANMASGSITNRADVIKTLENAGFRIARETKNSISIADPDGSKNIRLRGSIYERAFEFNENTRAAIEQAASDYAATAEQRIQQAHSELTSRVEALSRHNQRRYQRVNAEVTLSIVKHEANSAQHMGLLAPDNNHRANLDSWRFVVSGQPDSAEPSSDTRAREALDNVTKPNFWIEAVNARKQAIHTVPEKQENESAVGIERDERGRTGEQINDRTRVTVTEICKRVSDAARAAANGIIKKLQDFSEHVQRYVSREQSAENASEQLSRASERIRIATEQINEIANKIAMKNDLENDRGLHI